MSLPAGWYADGVTGGVVRWWDGMGWTTATQPLASPSSTASGAPWSTTPAARPAGRALPGGWWMAAILVVLVLGAAAVGHALLSSGESTAAPPVPTRGPTTAPPRLPALPRTAPAHLAGLAVDHGRVATRVLPAVRAELRTLAQRAGPSVVWVTEAYGDEKLVGGLPTGLVVVGWVGYTGNGTTRQFEAGLDVARRAAVRSGVRIVPGGTTSTSNGALLDCWTFEQNGRQATECAWMRPHVGVVMTVGYGRSSKTLLPATTRHVLGDLGVA